MAYRIAKSLDVLRSQFNAEFPNRNKKADGWIGDAAHASRTSDHNPWVKDGSMGIVTALDITHDPKNGVDIGTITEHMRQQRDSRIKYVICNGRIFSSTTSPWVWRTYTGSNPHSTHFHVSVNSTKGHYDSLTKWSIGQGNYSEPETSLPDDPSSRPTLKIGSAGDAVRVVQRLLKASVDGNFRAITEAHVIGFQVGSGLQADGIVGALTWAELDNLEQTPTDSDWQRGIIASRFGGKDDPNQSAYEDRWIDDEEFGVALPYRFPVGERPQVEVVNLRTGKRVVCDIVDVGPWETQDPYWDTPGQRPKAESGTDSRGRTTNKAGIDLTPGACDQIGLSGLEAVDWAFAGAKPDEA